MKINLLLAIPLLLSLLFVCCKKETLEPVVQSSQEETTTEEQKTAENYFTFLKAGNEFTYRTICTETKFQNPVDTFQNVTNKVRVTNAEAEHYYRLSRAFPSIDTRVLYSDSVFFGTNPFDTIIANDFKSTNWFTIYKRSIHKLYFKGDSIETIRIFYDQTYEFDDTETIYISKDKGIIFTTHSQFRSDWSSGTQFTIERKCTCELIDYNF